MQVPCRKTGLERTCSAGLAVCSADAPCRPPRCPQAPVTASEYVPNAGARTCALGNQSLGTFALAGSLHTDGARAAGTGPRGSGRAWEAAGGRRACPRPGHAPADTVRAGPARPNRWRARPPSPTSFSFRTFQTTQDDVFKRSFIKGCEGVIFIKTSVLRPNIVERMIHTGGTVFDSSFYSALSLPVIFLYVNKCA